MSHTQQEIIEAVLRNKEFNLILNGRLLRGQYPFNASHVVGIVQTLIGSADLRAADTMKELGLKPSELEKVDTTFRAARHFIQEWKLFRKAFSGSSVKPASLMPEAAGIVRTVVAAVERVLDEEVRREGRFSSRPLNLSSDRLLAILSGACRQSDDHSWSDDEQLIYEAACTAFKRERRDVSQEDWTLLLEKVLLEIERLLPAVRQQAMERKLHLTEGWLLRYTVSFLFPSRFYAGEGQEGTVSPTISDELADEVRQMLNERIDGMHAQNAHNIGTELLEAVKSTVEKVGWTHQGVAEDALLDLCYGFCRDVMAERFLKEQQISEAAAQVFQSHGLLPQDDVNSVVVAGKAFDYALQSVYRTTKELPTEKVLEFIFDVCFVPTERQAYQEREARLDSYATEWEEIVEQVARAVRPYLDIYNGVLLEYRKNLNEAFQKVHLWIKEALQAANERAEELELRLPTDRLVTLTIKPLR